MRQGLFFTLPDVVDAFVVSVKHTSRRDELKEQKQSMHVCDRVFLPSENRLLQE